MNVASHLDTETELRDLCDHDQEDRAAIRERHLAAWLFILSIGALAICLWRHTFYRDEAQAFLIARDSHSLKEVIENTRYEGHPPLWHVILFAVTRFGANPAWMKILNLLFFAAASAMLLFCRRLPVLFRSALPFTYFLFFEYGEISRNYLLGIVLLLAATLAMTQGKGLLKEVTIAAALGLAALTSLHAMVLSVVIAVI